MHRLPTWMRRGPVAALIMLSLLALLLAACGAETSTNGLAGRATSSVTVGTTVPSGTQGAYNPTPVPPPYAFPKSWQAASGAPSNVDVYRGMAFGVSTPLTGYACDDTPAAVSVTHDGGQTWASTTSTPSGQLAGTCSIFVNPADANDVVLQGLTGLSTQTTRGLWRSRDGGATWRQLAYPGVNTTVQKMTVLGARLVAAVALNGEGQLANDLYASDDGGTTWQPFAASLPANITDFVALGGSIVVETDPPVAGSGDVPVPGNTAHVGANRALDAASRLSSGGPPPVFFRSDDGGNTWNKVTYPGGLPVFTQAAGGGNYFGVSMLAPNAGNPPTAYWTQDSGATWKALPTLTGAGGGWVDDTSLGIGLIVGPDGSVFTDTLHPLNSYLGESDAGVFMVRPTDSAPAWQPLAQGYPFSMAALPTSGGIRLVKLQLVDPARNNLTPVYLDLP